MIALDLPGNGETEGEINMATVVDDHARIVRGVIDTIGYDVVDIVAFGGGGAVAVEFALNQPERVKTLLLRQVQCFELAEANDRMNWPLPDLTPAAHGAQMLNAWNFIRDRELFDPWHFQDRKTAIRGRDPDLDPARVHMRTMDLLKCGDAVFFAPTVRATLATRGAPLGASALPCSTSIAHRAVSSSTVLLWEVT